jgi:FixJ family two-component response regulator
MADRHMPVVVLVEDDASLALALTRNLAVAGLDVTGFRSGEALLDVGLHDDTLCLIIDIHLPGIDAFALLDRLAARGAVPPAIVITAFDSPGAREQASRAGVAAYLRKPFPSRTLLEAIESIRSARSVA